MYTKGQCLKEVKTKMIFTKLNYMSPMLPQDPNNPFHNHHIREFIEAIKDAVTQI